MTIVNLRILAMEDPGEAKYTAEVALRQLAGQRAADGRGGIRRGIVNTEKVRTAKSPALQAGTGDFASIE